MTAMLELDNMVLLCGACQEQHGDRRVLARATVHSGNVDDPSKWYFDIRPRKAPNRGDFTRRVDGEWQQFSIEGARNFWQAELLDSEKGPLVMGGCRRHNIERSRKKLAKVIARAYEAGEREVTVTA